MSKAVHPERRVGFSSCATSLQVTKQQAPDIEGGPRDGSQTLGPVPLPERAAPPHDVGTCPPGLLHSTLPELSLTPPHRLSPHSSHDRSTGPSSHVQILHASRVGQGEDSPITQQSEHTARTAHARHHRPSQHHYHARGGRWSCRR